MIYPIFYVHMAKQENLNENWYAGETLIAGIGLGYDLTTPLQLAVMTARIASGGIKIKPTLFIRNQEENFEQIENLSKYIEVIKKSMFKVVNEPKGTANKSKAKKYNFSRKHIFLRFQCLLIKCGFPDTVLFLSNVMLGSSL